MSLTFLDNVILRMRMSQICDRREFENASKKLVSGSDACSKETVVAPLPGYHCSVCMFPKHCKRSDYLYHRYLCPCDVDIVIEEKHYPELLNVDLSDGAAACSAGLNVDLLDGDVGGCREREVKMEQCPKVFARESTCDVPVNDEDQRRIDALNLAMASRRSFLPKTEEENINNSSTTSVDSNQWKSPSDGVTDTLSSSSQRQGHAMKRSSTNSSCSKVYSQCIYPIRVKTKRRPMFKHRGNQFAHCSRRSSLRYQPYRVIRREPYNNVNVSNKHLHTFPKPLPHSARQSCFHQDGCPIFSGANERIFQGRSREMFDDYGFNRMRTCTSNGCGGVLCSPPGNGCTEWAVPHWQYLCNVSRGCGCHPIQATERQCGDISRRVLCSRFRAGLPHHGATLHCGSHVVRLQDHDFLCRAARGFMGGDIKLALSDSSSPMVGPGIANEETASHFDGKNNSCSMGPTKVNSSRCSVCTLPAKQCDKTELCPEVDGNNPSLSRGHISLTSNDTRDAGSIFKFSRPLLAVSESKQQMLRSLSSSRVSQHRSWSLPPSTTQGSNSQQVLRSMAFFNPCNRSYSLERETQCMCIIKENTCDRHKVNATADKEIKTYGTPSNADITDDKNAKFSETPQNEYSGKDHVYPFGARAFNSIFKHAIGRRDNRNAFDQHCSRHFNGSACVLRCHDHDITSNNNNDPSRPITNTSLQNPAHRCGRTPLGGRVVKVEGDGRCLFRSLVTAEYPPLQVSWRDEFGRPVNRELADLETTRADRLRARVVTIMEDNIHFYSQLENGVINADQPMPSNYQRFLDRLRAMSEPSTMPGDLELNAVAMVMERQILVLDTNLAIITSYGHERFPQSIPLAVRYTRLVADVGHYDAVILTDDHSNSICGHGYKNSGEIKQGAPARESHSGLCGDFRRLTTSGDGQNNDISSTNGRVCPRGRFTGDAKLNAKKEFFYLRDSDKSLHSDGLQPVSTLATKGATTKPDMEQRTAEAATSTARATVHWPSALPGKCHTRRRRRKRQTFSDKHTQTDDEYHKKDDRACRAEWKKHYYKYRYGVCKPYKAEAGKGRRAGVTALGVTKRARRAIHSEKTSIKDQNINWNSRIRNLKAGIRRAHKSSNFRSERDYNVELERLCSSRFKKCQHCTFITKAIEAHSTEMDNISQNVKAQAKCLCSKNTTYSRRGVVPGVFGKTNSNAARKSPTTYINICSPTRHSRPGKPEVRRPRAASPSANGRRGKSVSGRNRGKRKRVQPVSPGSPHSPLFLAKKPRLPDAFEPLLSRCILCSGRIEVTARESVKCYMCGQMAHRACVMKEFSGWGQGGGDQNYFICSFCVPV